MDDAEVAGVLERCERELAGGRVPDLRAIGFWRAVAATKRRADLVARYADRIARIERAAFRHRTPLTFPLAVGVVLNVGGLAVDVGFLVAAAMAGAPWREVLLLVGTGGLLVATHGLAHLIVGRAVGIRFTDWFSQPPLRPQPGFKIDYASYLRTPARARAWMHASGAIVSKIVPFACASYGAVIGADAWAGGVLIVVGTASIVIDLLISVRSSDWKRFRREMRFAR